MAFHPSPEEAEKEINGVFLGIDPDPIKFMLAVQSLILHSSILDEQKDGIYLLVGSTILTLRGESLEATRYRMEPMVFQSRIPFEVARGVHGLVSEFLRLTRG